MLDDRVRTVLARLEEEDRREREEGVARELRARQVARTTGQFLFSLVAPQTDCEVLEIGGSRGYSTIWLAAGVRHLGGRVLSLELDPRKCEAWRRNIAEAGLEDWAELDRGRRARDAAGDRRRLRRRLPRRREGGLRAPRSSSRAGRSSRAPLFVADNVLSHADTLGAYSRARQDDPTLESVTVPLDRGLELLVRRCAAADSL